jgi:hypothetical protein
MSEDDRRPMTQMSLYVPVDVRRRYKALCALEGVTLGQKIEELLVREEEKRDRHTPVPAVPSSDL